MVMASNSGEGTGPTAIAWIEALSREFNGLTPFVFGRWAAYSDFLTPLD
jgi:hypothetical protein